ncbi:MAG TPA: exodeoxyribonuclease III [Rhodanobacteraceae bacterium]
MRIVSLNANGIRSAASKGLFEWLAGHDADILCMQETKARAEQLEAATFHPAGYHRYLHDARSKKGYSGVAIFSREQPDEVRDTLGREDFDCEGRYLEARFGNLSVVSLYFPSGSSGDERQDYKFRIMEWFKDVLDEWLASGRDYVVCGDWNIVRSERDIKNWKTNQKNSGCLPAERAWLNGMISDASGDGTPAPTHGWRDSLRVIEPEAAEYTWWSNRGQARANNVGWRIDYQLVTPAMAERVKAFSVYRDERFSDHAPYTVDYAG